jgi:hypothetical protein
MSFVEQCQCLSKENSDEEAKKWVGGKVNLCSKNRSFKSSGSLVCFGFEVPIRARVTGIPPLCSESKLRICFYFKVTQKIGRGRGIIIYWLFLADVINYWLFLAFARYSAKAGRWTKASTNLRTLG